jgi:hypothetical protein
VSRKNECLIAITNVLDDAQIAYIVRHGSKHLHVLFTVNGRNQKCVCSISPSDRNAQHNARAHAKRMVKELA